MSYLCIRKHCHGLSLVSFWHKRKVRAAQGAPLLKVEAIGDSRLGQKRMTALRLKDIRIQYHHILETHYETLL